MRKLIIYALALALGAGVACAEWKVIERRIVITTNATDTITLPAFRGQLNEVYIDVQTATSTADVAVVVTPGWSTIPATVLFTNAETIADVATNQSMVIAGETLSVTFSGAKTAGNAWGVRVKYSE